MVMSQLVRDFIVDTTEDPADRREVFNYYGTFTRAMITMFEIHLANFAPACRVLVDYCGEGYAYLFLAYRCVAGFAVLNVINAVFVQQTIKVAQQDHDVMVENQRKSQVHFSTELRRLFNR